MLFQQNINNPFLDRIVTCDEKWILYDNLRRSGQWLDCDEPPKHFPKPKFHQQKILATVWWCAIGVIHYSFLDANQSITAEAYRNQLKEMRARLQKVRPALVNRCGRIIVKDNARLHIARKTLQKLTDLGYETLPHPSYSPDLSPTDYHFRGSRFFKQQNFQLQCRGWIYFQRFHLWQ